MNFSLIFRTMILVGWIGVNFHPTHTRVKFYPKPKHDSQDSVFLLCLVPVACNDVLVRVFLFLDLLSSGYQNKQCGSVIFSSISSKCYDHGVPESVQFPFQAVQPKYSIDGFVRFRLSS